MIVIMALIGLVVLLIIAIMCLGAAGILVIQSKYPPGAHRGLR